MDPADLCDLCVHPAVQTVRMRDDWADLEAGDVVKTCGSCGDWLVQRGLAGSVAAMTRKALR